MNALRQRQMRNMHMALMLSQGTPMVLMGEPLPSCRLSMVSRLASIYGSLYLFPLSIISGVTGTEEAT